MATVPANVPPKTLTWLWAVVRPEYRDAHRAYSDLVHALSRYPGLGPRTDVYTFENGTHALLVRLVGTVPATFRGTVYRFPIAVWLPHAYPYEAPIVYVTPTEEMVVRQGQHVAGDGRIYHHYLAHWPEAWDRSNVADLLTILCGIFSHEPPVMAKSQQQRQQQQQQQQPPPRPPLPSTSAQSAPRPPPKEPSQERSSSPAQVRPGRYDAPLPLPQPQARPEIRSSSNGSIGTVTVPPATPSPYAQQVPRPSQAWPAAAEHHTQTSAPSLLDSPFDIPLPVAEQNLPAPPIPRNPEKEALLSHLSAVLTDSLHAQIRQNSAAIAPLQGQNAALQSTVPRLQAELAALSALQDTLTSNVAILQESLAAADQTISSARRRAAAGDMPTVDDMLVAPHVVGKQLYDVVTDERGIETAIFALHDAFVRGRVSVDVWSRKTRELARDAFKKRYLTRKIGIGLGLEAA